MTTTDTTSSDTTTGQPDLGFYFAIHRSQRTDLERYRQAVVGLDEADRSTRGPALRRWAKGFAMELDEHAHIEDRFFFPSLRAKVPSATPTLDRLDADHRRFDELLATWPALARDLADPKVPFVPARTAVAALAEELADLLGAHLDVEDEDVLPLFWRHYSPAEYDALQQEAIRRGKKAGLWFVAPFTVDCYAEGPERDAFLASVPGVLRLLHRLVRPRYDRMIATAFAAG